MTRAARAAAAAVFLAAFACGQASSVPPALHGRWESGDPRYAGRTLEIGAHVVRFVDGNAELDAITVRGVVAEGEPGTAQRVVIDGSARDGSAIDLALELQTVPDERLRFETQDAVWHRAAVPPLVSR